MTAEVSPQDFESLFTLRAEDLSTEALKRWTAQVPGDESILRKLVGPGPKLLKGPRGSGKSSYLKRAYFSLRARPDVLVAYINYSTHLALEPLMLRNERALEYFRQWLIYKVIVGLDDSAGVDAPSELRGMADEGRRYISELATQVGEPPTTSLRRISPADLLQSIEGWLVEMGRNRAVLLMDDAAHAFMHQQQREFFEVFRALRSRQVACKAAIYPGVTSYSPFFNVGHEAEEIEIWIRPDGADYLETMHAIFKARFPEEFQAQVRPALVEMAAHAAFGLPRNFLNILSDALGDPSDEESTFSAPTLQKLRPAIQLNAKRVRDLFAEIGSKLPRYEKFVEAGTDLTNEFVDLVRQSNKLRDRAGAKYVGVAVTQPWGSELTQVVSLLEYAGMVRRIEPVSRGRARYERVQVHSSVLIADTALGLSRSPSVEETNRAFVRQSADDFVRRQQGRIATPGWLEKCHLNLSPCPVCQTPRVSEDAVFCFKCGASLMEESVYLSLLEASVEQLSLPKLKTRLIQEADIRTVQDVILDQGGARLRGVRSVGGIWSARIKARAEEFITL